MKHNKYTVLSFLGMLALSVMLVSCYSLWDDLGLPQTEPDIQITTKDITITGDDTDSDKYVFTADVSALGLNDADVTWIVNGDKKGTGKTFEMKYADYPSDEYKVSVQITEGNKTYIAEDSFEFELVYFYEVSIFKGEILAFMRGNKLLCPYDSDGILVTNSAFTSVNKWKDSYTDAETGADVNVITLRKTANYGVYSGETNLYEDASDGHLTTTESGNNFFTKGSYYQGYDGTGTKNSAFDMVVFSNANGTYLIPLADTAIKASDLDFPMAPKRIGDSKSTGSTDKPILYKDKKGITNTNMTYYSSEGYVLIGGERYYIIDVD